MNTENPSPFVYQGYFETASYTEQRVPSFQGNPLIEALPPVLTKDEVYKRIKISPLYEEQHRRYSLEERLLMLGHGRRFFEPMSMHFDLVRRFGSMLREGYVGRNPLQLGYYRAAQEKLDNILQNPVSCDLPLGLNLGLTMMGISGIGKSRSLERASSLYPQIIQHSWYKDRRFTWTQLVWFKLDCPHDGSILGLCTNFFRQVDMVLGTNYFRNYGIRNRPSQDAMISYMTTVASNHSLGILIIDEIQNLKRAKDSRMLDFFVQLDNEIGVPVVLVGTPDAEDILSGDLRRARRASGQGDMRWNRMQNDIEWKFFLESLWHYQYTQYESPLSDELIQTMYFETQGITDLAIKLYFLAQRYAMVTKGEHITRENIRQAAKLGLNLVQPFLSFLRTNDVKKIKTYGNLPSQDIEAEVQHAETELTKQLEAASPFGLETAKNDNGASSPGAILKMDTQTSQKSGELSNSSTSRTQEQKWNETLPQVVAQTLKKQQITAYEALKQAGYICNVVEYLSEEGVL